MSAPEPPVAPTPLLSDGAISLRPWRPDDNAQLATACDDAETHRYIGTPLPYSTQDAHDYIARTTREWEDGSKASFAIVDAESHDTVLGAINVAIVGSTGNSGYWVAPTARGSGVASRALRLLTDWAFDSLGLGAIILEIRAENAPSRAVAEAAGYHQAGRLDVNTETGKKGGLIYSLLATDR